MLETKERIKKTLRSSKFRFARYGLITGEAEIHITAEEQERKKKTWIWVVFAICEICARHCGYLAESNK